MHPILSAAERWGLASIFLLLLAISLEFAALRAGAPLWSSAVVLASSAAATALLFAANDHRTAPRFPLPTSETLRCFAVIGMFAAGLTLIYREGCVLPMRDHINVPALARTIASGVLPHQVYSPATRAFIYPPGEPILFAPFVALLSPIDALLVFKILSLAVVALIPATWAWMHARLFPSPIQPWLRLAISYLVFFGIERTLGFAVAMAGKNAVLLAVLLFPLVAVLVLTAARRRFGWILGGAALFGLTLVHYSMLHLCAAFLGSYVVVALVTRRMSFGEAIRIVAMGVIATASTLVMLREVIADPKAGALPPDVATGLGSFLQILFARDSQIAIYNDSDFGIPGFPYRGLALFGCTAFTVAGAWAIGMPRLRDCALVSFSAFLISLGFAVGIIPAGVVFDYARWYMWAIQALVFLTASVALWHCATTSTRPASRACLAASAAVAVFAVYMMIADARVHAEVAAERTLTRSELAQMMSTLENASAGRECRIIGDSIEFPEVFLAIQLSGVLDYAEVVTSCRYVNGSWVDSAIPGGREIDGFPSVAALESIPRNAALLLVAREAREQEYSAQLRARGVDWNLERVGEIAGMGVWKRRGS